ncbi:MAG TPA: phosphate ABC transporter substrate-binding protein PstS [Pyrinomonadaceae bacterium]|jgi:phosphate transport system substrate-binding protein|nr:phosphate ABC transporter substrate-binding protein PstS [Pyrinomonadaceae bacterium]
MFPTPKTTRRRRSSSSVAFAALLAFVLAFAAACSGERADSTTPPGADASGDTVRLQGAGATFPMPIYQKWLSEYGKVNPKAKIDYQSIGSGGGIQQIQSQTVDFGASDAPMSDDDLKKAPGELLHIPTVLGAVVVTYNLQGVTQPLRFSPDVVADIFLGKIKKWDDARIKADNPGVSLPANDIAVVHRSDGSGTTAVFTDYLSKVSPEWKTKPGAGKSIDWPTGQGGKGNEGVSGQIKQQPNTVGYVELAYAVQTKLPVALLKNKAGNFVEPSLDAVTAAAAESLPTTPEDLRVSITDAAGATAYPISSYTYILVYREQKDAAKGKALVDFLWWALHDGESFAKNLQYAPLPTQIVEKASAKLNSITSGGKTLRGA